MIKKGDLLYYPTQDFKKKAWLKNKEIYKKAAGNPIKFWESLAKELFWFKKWKNAFVHKPPYFQWFVGGKINITSNIFENNSLGWENIKNKVALIWEPEPINEGPEKLTYEELFRKVNKLANALLKLRVKKGDRVGIYLPMIPEVIISMLACARIGAVHSVVFSAFSPQALKIRLQDTEAKVLITADGYYRRGQIINLKQNADAALSGEPKGRASLSKAEWEGIQEIKVEKVIVVKRAKNEIPWQEEKDIWWHELIEKENDKCDAEVMDSEDLLFILYTSGSTGKPKGCVHTCGGFTVQAYWTGKWIFDFHDEDIFWCTSDPGWVTGHTYTIYSPLLNGIATLMFEGAPDWPTPDRWTQIIEKYGITTFYTAPTVIRMFEKTGAEKFLEKSKLKTLQLLGSVGEPIDESAWQWYFKEVGKEKCPLVDTWWQTETGGILITSLPGIGPFKPAFTGLPFPGTKFDILDEKGKSLPPNKEGNLVMLPPFAPGLLRGIYKDPKKYLDTYWSQYAAFDIVKGEPRPLKRNQLGRGKEIYFTSDAAYKDKQGLIRIVGRVDDVIKIAGHRLTTGELEAAINLHPDITECAVVGIPDEIKGEVPVAFIVSKSKRASKELEVEVREQVKKEIGPITMLKKVFLVEDLPKTRSGKIMRRILKRLFTLQTFEKQKLGGLTGEEFGDLSTLSNPQSVRKIKEVINKVNSRV
ncbi:MAG: acetate--CoA ligase [Candidatus Nealsonbacteria bacterium CG_4_10_14_0_2_um_filter_35_20]|uniref:Acetate--CoA ligase n=1 Tax=Candidatus Nealsonbacteria bacterium CG02_land_8_20_14_3_00_34_20 TaxID=1974698 RepID=A0A2M7DAE4_9BACT|nr:MAG: acetate--CoA ligase [Candidatus Nealsonbacteria bacterium CG02_land_8_20_14_3_00_34_20]PIW92679.1 MAG: acetate--CoA ligase [Candidatus Nealsonbacteria bacterium CG_4_8_14_3_um_filter_34_13]PIZ89791.1 MAG: acetate--CoA ligase [Candidatus Nealsonbacteria bacterium CG_4_10_14_0_2_um_filter_35_20]